MRTIEERIAYLEGAMENLLSRMERLEQNNGVDREPHVSVRVLGERRGIYFCSPHVQKCV